MDLDRIRYQAELDQWTAELGEELKEHYTREELDMLHELLCEYTEEHEQNGDPLEGLMGRVALIGLYHTILSMPPVEGK